MKLGCRRTILGAIATTMVYLLGVASAGGQAEPEQKPLMAEDAFKNVQLLRGITVSQFMATMGFFSAALNANCTFCHGMESGGSWARYADDSPRKQTARRMILMMATINQTNFAGRRMVTCYTCHRGSERPKVTPNLAEVYGAPVLEEPDEILEQAPGAPSADQLLDRYIQALGGPQRVASLTSFVAKGMYQGYDDPDKRAAELYAKAPGQRTTIVHTSGGDSTTVYDGRSGWITAPDTITPVPVIPLTGGDLDGAKVDADLCFPAQVKQTLSEWRVGFPATIDGREVQVVQGTSAWGSPVKLYFDKKSGLLVRQLRYTNVPVGRVPTQIDYADYREVSGVKMPFRWTVTWVDGRSTTELSEVHLNAPIDAAKFAKPAPSTPSARAATP
jgi:photosynthetic reaction center cytochrome c subunit